MSPAPPHHRHPKGGNVVFHCRVEEPAPSGPQRVRCEPSSEIEGGVQGSPARWMMVDSVRAKLLVTGGSCQADLLRQRPRVGLPRPQGCEACGGTVPAPTLRRLASAPLDRSRSAQRYSRACSRSQEQSENIAHTRTRTLPSPLQRERVACAVGRDRGRAYSKNSPSPGSLRSPPSPAKGGRVYRAPFPAPDPDGKGS